MIIGVIFPSYFSFYVISNRRVNKTIVTWWNGRGYQDCVSKRLFGLGLLRRDREKVQLFYEFQCKVTSFLRCKKRTTSTSFTIIFNCFIVFGYNGV